jgi:hypothetical protein
MFNKNANNYMYMFRPIAAIIIAKAHQLWTPEMDNSHPCPLALQRGGI